MISKIKVNKYVEKQTKRVIDTTGKYLLTPHFAVLKEYTDIQQTTEVKTKIENYNYIATYTDIIYNIKHKCRENEDYIITLPFTDDEKNVINVNISTKLLIKVLCMFTNDKDIIVLKYNTYNVINIVYKNEVVMIITTFPYINKK